MHFQSLQGLSPVETSILQPHANVYAEQILCILLQHPVTPCDTRCDTSYQVSLSWGLLSLLITILGMTLGDLMPAHMAHSDLQNMLSHALPWETPQCCIILLACHQAISWHFFCPLVLSMWPPQLQRHTYFSSPSLLVKVLLTRL